jgi:hypothetical protein
MTKHDNNLSALGEDYYTQIMEPMDTAWSELTAEEFKLLIDRVLIAIEELLGE